MTSCDALFGLPHLLIVADDHSDQDHQHLCSATRGEVIVLRIKLGYSEPLATRNYQSARYCTIKLYPHVLDALCRDAAGEVVAVFDTRAF